MKFNFKTDDRRVEITILPMVNIVFLLLIFFMLVGRVSAPDDLNVSPPISKSGERAGGKPIQVVIATDGRMTVDGTGVDMTALIVAVTQKVARDPAIHFQLKADAALDANALIRIMETFRRSGVKELTLVTDRQG